MRTFSRYSFACLSCVLAFAATGCGDDARHDDLFADSNGTEIAAGTSGNGGASAGTSAGQPSGGAPSTTGTVTASGSTEVAAESGGSPSSGASGSGSAASGNPPSGGGPSGGGSASPSTSSSLTADLRLCGKLEAFTAAGAQAGACTIGGKTLPIAAGTSVSGQVLAVVGADVCLDAKIDSNGSVRASASLSLDLALDLDLDARARAKACGKVTAYAAASTTTKGDVAIGGASFDIAAGATVTGSAKLVVGASVCVDARLDRSGAVVAATVSTN